MADGDVLKISGGHQVFGAPSGGGVTVTGSQGGSVSGATTFRAAGTVVDLGSGVAGQGLVAQLLGPVRVNFDDTGDVFGGPDTFAGGATLAVFDIPEGAVVTQVWAETIAAFNAPAESIQFLMANASSSSGMSIISTWFVFQVQRGGTNAFAFASEDDSTPGEHRIFRALADARICVSLNVGSDTAGAADIYAIIATPAS